MGILDDFYKFMSPGTMEEKVIEEKKPMPLVEEVDPRAMQQLYQQMLQDANRPITDIELEREVEDKKDNIEAQLEAQNTEKLSDMYETIMAGAGEFGTGEYKGPTKKQLGLTPKVIVDEGPQDFMVEEKPVESLGTAVVVAPPEETPEDKKTRLVNTPLLTDNYFEDSLDIDRFKIFYQGHNPAGKRKKNFKEAYDRATTDPKIQSNIEKNNVVSIIDSVIPAFPELKNHKIFNRDAFIKLAKYESAGGDLLVNKKTNDYGMFQLNEENIKRIFGTKKDFVNDTYTTDDKKKGIIPKGKKVGDTITSEEATKRADSAKKTFDGSFSQYFGDLAKSVTGYSANDLKKLYGENSKDFVRNFLKNNHKVNLGVAIAGTIMPNLDATKK